MIRLPGRREAEVWSARGRQLALDQNGRSDRRLVRHAAAAPPSLAASAALSSLCSIDVLHRIALAGARATRSYGVGYSSARAASRNARPYASAAIIASHAISASTENGMLWIVSLGMVAIPPGTAPRRPLRTHVRINDDRAVEWQARHSSPADASTAGLQDALVHCDKGADQTGLGGSWRDSTFCRLGAGSDDARAVRRVPFPAGESPGEHVDRYWSITLYSHPDVKLVPKPTSKYSISVRSGLEPDQDGDATR